MVLRKDAKIELLQRTALFAQLSKAELRELAALADEIDIPAGTPFIREGERGREFFALVEGKVDVRKRGRSVKIKGGCQAFGEMSLLTDAPRNATVVASTPVRALVIPRRSFSGLMRRMPSLQLKLLQSLAARAAADEPV